MEERREEKEEGEEDEGLEIGRERLSFYYAQMSLIITNTLLSTEYIQEASPYGNRIVSIHSINSSIRQLSHQFFHPMLLLLVSTRLFTALCPFGSVPASRLEYPLGFHLSEVAGDGHFLQTVRKKITIIIVDSGLLRVNLCSKKKKHVLTAKVIDP
jgi:hypothetical protein